MHSQPRRIARILAAFLLVAGALVVAPSPVQATNSDWTHEVIGGLTDSLHEFGVAHDGERLGFAFRYQNTPFKTGFAIRSSAGVWSVNSQDVGLGASADNLRLEHVTGSTWLLSAADTPAGFVHKIYRTTNDGTTWTNVYTSASTPCGTTDNFYNDIAVYTTTIVGAIGCRGGGPWFMKSTDGGATWPANTPDEGTGGPIYQYADNKGAPTGTATATCDGGTPSLNHDDFGTTLTRSFVIVGASGSGMTEVDSPITDGAFWTVACGTGTSPACVPQELATIQCYWASASVVSRVHMGGDGQSIVAWVQGSPAVLQSKTSAGFSFVQSGTPATTIDQVFPTCTATFQPGLFHAAVDGNSAGLYVAAETCVTPTAGMLIRYKQGLAGTWTDTFTQGGVDSRDIAVEMTPSKTFVFFTNSTFGHRAELVWSLSPTAVDLAPIASRSVTSLVGFDADPFNQVVTARLLTAGSTSSVNTFDASSATLDLRGASPVATDCNIQDGVMAYSTSANGAQYAGFLDCDSSHNNVNAFKIRAGDLNAATFPGTGCDNTDCSTDLTGANDSYVPCTAYPLPQGAIEIGTIAAIPISYESGSSGVPAHTQTGFVYTNIANGNIGTWAFRNQGVDGAYNSSCREEVAFSAPGNTYQICSWRNSIDGKDYIAAAGPANPTKAWQFTIDSFNPLVGIETHLTPIAAGLSAPYDHLRAIACVDNDAIVTQASSGQVSRIHIVGGGIGGVVWGPIAGPTGTVVQRGATFSRDGKWAAIASSTTVQVLNATSGAVLLSIPMPAGTFKEMRISSAGQILWVATSSTIAEYDVHPYTTIESVPEGTTGTGPEQVCRDGRNNVIPCVGTGTSTSSTTTCSLLCVDETTVPEGFTVGAFNLFLGVILMLSIAVGVFFVGGKSPIMGGAGAVGGFLIGFAFGLFPLWIVIVLVILSVAVIMVKMRAGAA